MAAKGKGGRSKDLDEMELMRAAAGGEVEMLTGLLRKGVCPNVQV